MSSSKGKIQRLFTSVEENTDPFYVIQYRSILIQIENRLKNHIPDELFYLEDLVFHKMEQGY